MARIETKISDLSADASRDSLDIISRNRFGRVYIKEDYITKFPSLMLQIFSKFLVVRAEYDLRTRSLIYDGYCALFEPRAEAEPIIVYTLEIEEFVKYHINAKFDHIELPAPGRLIRFKEGEFVSDVVSREELDLDELPDIPF